MIETSTLDLSQIIDSIAEGVVVVDRDWKVGIWNKAAQNILGRSPKELLGADFRSQISLLKEQDRSPDYEAIEKTLKSGSTNQPENSILALDQNRHEVPLTYTAAPLFNREGKVDGAVIIFRDLIQEREAFRLRSDFTYLQHQLRSPITSALWGLQTALKSDQLDEGTKSLLSQILIALESINLLSNRLIEISQLDQGLVAIQEGTTSLKEIVDLALGKVNELFQTKAIDFKINANMILDKQVVTDKNTCAKILEELLKNAALYSESGKQITLNLASKEEGVVFEVIDQGFGIPMEEQSLVFTKFFRGMGVSQSVAGAGLGLYTALRYAKLLGAKLWFVSKPGLGSTFSLWLPAK